MDFISFQSPWAWAFLPLAAVPWLLHLLRRRRARLVPFPSLLLLTERRPVVWRRFRLEELLLLAVRTLLVVALVAVLARPVVRGWLPGWLSPAEQWVVAILDDSASMAAASSDGSAMGLARSRLASMLEGLGTGARVAVIGGGRGAPVLAGFGTAKTAARAVRESSARPVGTELVAALSKADRMLAQAKSPAIMIASDFQASALAGIEERLERPESGAGIVLIDAGLKPVPANLRWLSVRASSLRGRITVEGRWTGQGPARIGLEQAGMLVHRASVPVGEGGLFTAGLELPRGDSILLRTWDNGLDLDNDYYLGGTAAGVKTCLLIAGTEGAGQSALGKALESLSGAGWSWKRAASLSPGEAAEAGAFLVAAARLDAQTISSLVASTGPGRGLVIVPPPQAEPDQYNRLLSELGSSARITGLAPAGEHPLRISPGPGPLGPEWDVRSAGAVQVRRYWKTAGAGPAAMSIGGRDPGLVLEKTPRGPLALWLFGADPAMSDLAYRAAFPVMLHRSLEHAGEWVSAVQYRTGDSLRLEALLATELAMPGGSSSPGTQEGRQRTWKLSVPGWYLASGPGGRRLMAANIPPEESDLDPVARDELEAVFGNARWASESAPAGLAGPGQPAWKALLLMALLMAAAEAGLRIRLAGQKNG